MPSNELRRRAPVTSNDNDNTDNDSDENDRHAQRRATIGSISETTDFKDFKDKMQSAETVKKAESSVTKFLRRLVFGSIAFAIFRMILEAGALYLVLMIVAAQFQVYKELVNVRYQKYKRDKVGQLADVPMFRTLQWFWFLVAMFHTYGTFLKKYASDKKAMQWVSKSMHMHQMVTFALFSLAFILSIVTIRPKSLKYQVGHLSWTVVSIVIVCAQMIQAPFMCHSGTFWFFFPAFLVINNDCWAYVYGMLFGKRFIKRTFLALSPNKTWEGFIGATIMTVIAGWYSADIFSDRMEFICPTETLGVVPLDCVKNDIFVHQTIQLYPMLQSFGFPAEIDAKPIQLHAISFALVASLVAPFGGFMASAIKRANGVKDFASIIPGHGGFTDRLDCQMLMSLYVWVHFSTLVMPYVPLRDRLVDEFAMLSNDDRTYVLDRLLQINTSALT
eukprot:m.89164 g.89164  ORF g.89164 m.89164 type:complete len:446 (+) comp26270_c0_seq1:143-1480(+)